MARPTIGDFRSNPQNTPRAEVPETPSAVERTPEEREAAEKSAESLLSNVFLSPAEKYRERLKAAEIDLKTAEMIYDNVLSKGYHEEYVRLRGNHRAVLRTRMYDDHLRLQTILEMQKPQLAISQDELITRYNLAASLHEWEGVVLQHKNDDDFDKVLAIIKRLPAPLFTVLARELSKFDTKVMLVFSEGADESF